MYAGSSSLSKLTADKLNIREQNHMSDSGKLYTPTNVGLRQCRILGLNIEFVFWNTKFTFESIGAEGALRLAHFALFVFVLSYFLLCRQNIYGVNSKNLCANAH